MPHFTTEFSKGLDETVDMQQIMQICLDAAKNSKLFDMASAESRAYEAPYSLNINGEVRFLHIKIAMFSGRTDAQKAALSQAVYQGVVGKVNQPVNISVQVVDIEPQFCFHN